MLFWCGDAHKPAISLDRGSIIAETNNKNMSLSSSSSSSGDSDRHSNNHKKENLFPFVLYRILSSREWEDVVSWNEPHGKSFKIHHRTAFLERVLVHYGIRQSHYKSFVRQLNLWGFSCIHGGKKNAERGSYFHPLFLRDDPSRLGEIHRVKIKGNATRRRSNKPSRKQEQAQQDSSGMMTMEPSLMDFWDQWSCSERKDENPFLEPNSSNDGGDDDCLPPHLSVADMSLVAVAQQNEDIARFTPPQQGNNVTLDDLLDWDVRQKPPPVDPLTCSNISLDLQGFL